MISITLWNIQFTRGIEFVDTKNGSVSILVKGHALFESKGKDIICAAVSALAQTLVRSISIIGDIEQNLVQENGLLRTEIILSDLIEEKKNFNNSY